MTSRSPYFWYYLFFFSCAYGSGTLLTLLVFGASIDHRVTPGRPDDEGLGMSLFAVFGLLLDFAALLIFRRSWAAWILCGLTALLAVVAMTKLLA
ncbi:hypothetical protein F5972_36350 [Microbispora cellulosiformans]|uniref:Uncharacterized protein n=1 Tax=Microbispora cellulosiformans TaxID=2614688 RepID=A0A5J5JUH5_9ACTN|nr:hypothetical protein [Microbispora cellulosiformans]KAA9373198.1 hypothetical protein F5972_36350 [Microbispora cellulosiformans]